MNASEAVRGVRGAHPFAPRLQRHLLAPEWRRGIELGAPIALTARVNVGMSVTDTWMVSRLGTSAVAAVAVGSDLSSIVL